MIKNRKLAVAVGNLDAIRGKIILTYHFDNSGYLNNYNVVFCIHFLKLLALLYWIGKGLGRISKWFEPCLRHDFHRKVQQEGSSSIGQRLPTSLPPLPRETLPPNSAQQIIAHKIYLKHRYLHNRIITLTCSLVMFSRFSSSTVFATPRHRANGSQFGFGQVR